MIFFLFFPPKFMNTNVFAKLLALNFQSDDILQPHVGKIGNQCLKYMHVIKCTWI